MRTVNLEGISYLGADVVAELVSANLAKHSMHDINFVCLDAVTDGLPKADLVICRDLLVHLDLKDGLRVLQNVYRSGAKYLLTTTFPDRRVNREFSKVYRNWRPLNLEISPFRLPRPILLINEDCREGQGQFRDKSLGLWSVAELGLLKGTIRQ